MDVDEDPKYGKFCWACCACILIIILYTSGLHEVREGHVGIYYTGGAL